MYNNLEESIKQELLDKMRGYTRDRRNIAHQSIQHTPSSNAQPTGCLIHFSSNP